MSDQFVITVVVVVEWYNNYQVVDDVVVVIDLAPVTVEMVFLGGAVYVIGVE